ERLHFAHADARGGSQAVWLLAQDWGLPVPRIPSPVALAAARRSAEWQAALNRRETVGRAWSPLGLLWALLLDELENAPALGTCLRCSRQIQGTRRKRYCSPADNPECYRARRAAAKLRERRMNI